MIEIETIEVRLGERTYAIQQLGHLRAKPWKKRLLAEVQPIFDQVTSASDQEINTPADLLGLLPLAERLFIDALDMVFELLIAYSPTLEADCEYIESCATDTQILAAFQEAVKLSDPFGVVAQLNRQLGRRTNGTS